MITYPTRRWAWLVFQLRGSVFPRIAARSLIFAAVAAGFVALRELGIVDTAISGAAHAMVGVALGLLLVFRTNASYDRYWEGRRLLSEIANHIRNLARQTQSFLGPGGCRAEVRRLLPALYPLIRRHLRDERDWPELAAVLTREELAELESAATPPLACIKWISDLLTAEANAGLMVEPRLRHVDVTMGQMVGAIGHCERIAQTPVPFAYAHHIKAFLFIFCLTAPMALLSSMGWGAPGAIAVIVYGLYGIDEIGVEIEDPFGNDPNDLPLDAIGETLEVDVDQTLAATRGG